MYFQRNLFILLASTLVTLLSFGGRSSKNAISVATATKPSLEVITASNADRLAPLATITESQHTSLFSPIWSPDGHFLAVIETPPEGETKNLESFILLFDTSDFTTPIRQIKKEYAEFIEFSPDSKLLLSLDTHEGLTVYDVSTGKQKYSFAGRGVKDFEAHFSPDGKLLCVDRGGEIGISLLDANTGVEKLHLPNYQMGGVFSPDGSMLSTIEDGNANNPTQSIIWFWDIKSGKGTAFRKTSHKRAMNLTYSPNNDILAIQDFDFSIELVNFRTGQQQFFFQPHYPYTGGSALIFSQNKTLLAAFGPGEGYLWDYVSGKELAMFQNINADPGYHSAVFSLDSSLLCYWGTEDHRLMVKRKQTDVERVECAG